MTDRTCRTCIFWGRGHERPGFPKPAFALPEWVDDANQPLWKSCGAAIGYHYGLGTAHNLDENDPPETEQQAIIVIDVAPCEDPSDTRAGLHTHRDFGCIVHAPCA